MCMYTPNGVDALISSTKRYTTSNVLAETQAGTSATISLYFFCGSLYTRLIDRHCHLYSYILPPFANKCTSRFCLKSRFENFDQLYTRK